MPFAALINMFMTSFFMGNRQIFKNVVFPRLTVNDPVLSGHKFNISLFSASWDLSYPPLIMLWLFLLLVPLSVFVMYLIEKCAPQLLSPKVNATEGLANYFEAVDNTDKSKIVYEEKYFREKYVRIIITLILPLECKVYVG